MNLKEVLGAFAEQMSRNEPKEVLENLRKVMS